MSQFNRVLVALDRSDSDSSLLKYFSWFSDISDAKVIYFLHIVPDLTHPERPNLEFQHLFAPELPLDERIRNDIAEAVNRHFGHQKGMEIYVDVREGQPYNKLLHWAEVKNADLLVTGKKRVSENSGITPKRLARHANCNVLLVPEGAAPVIRKILVPTDFSENSFRALHLAMAIAKRLPEGVEIVPIHIVDMLTDEYYVPIYQQSGYAALMVDSAKNAWQNFIKKHHIEASAPEPVFVENTYNNIPKHLLEYAQNGLFDLLLIGATGHSAFERFIYGSVTERVVERGSLPVMVVR